ncbi:hypothetical protein [Streptomyces reticuli]|uniref:hypothetical protein n=1 Tax=Streptomyces reticuli TaxID=1926 RepID=UPI00073E05A5|nr:hypothetical protein [Streptomyces sp. SID7810]CUW29681.1 hypothetical protein TUE45_04390 [Streptomyces reticuli]
MAERDDETLGALAHSISMTYSLLVDVCQALPVPITLPADRHVPVTGAVSAIQRVAELVKDQPMGELQEMQLFTGCIHLLAAIDLYVLCVTRYQETRAEGVGANLIYSDEALRRLLAWLLTNGTA